MDKIKNFLYIAVVCVLWACGSNGSGTSAQQYIPVEPDYKNADAFKEFGRPRLGFLVSAGNIDSMVAHYTAAKKKRSSEQTRCPPRI